MEAETLMSKLVTLQKIKSKNEDLESVSFSLKHELQMQSAEENNLKEYKQELEQLLTEKLYHVEQLRQIHSDINMIENVIKQGQDALKESETRSRLLYKQYIPLKREVNDLRTDVGLLEVKDEELDSLQLSASSFDARCKVPKKGSAPMSQIDSRPSPSPGSSGPSRKRAAAHSIDDSSSEPVLHNATRPPMKQCISCQQFIHRNAPICPLCKAKSRSRNPKKGKN